MLDDSETRIEQILQLEVEQVQPPLPAAEPEIASSRRRVLEYWIIGIVLAGFALIAGVHIRTASIWYDEAVTLLITSGHAPLDWSYGMHQFEPTANLAKILFQLYHYDVHPPLYFWTLALWRVLFGGSLEAARAMSALFSLGTLVLLYRFAVVLGMRWAFVPAALYALSGTGLRYAYNARPYAMASFLIVLTLYLVRQHSNWSGVCAGACVSAHYFAALIIGPLLAMECARRWKANRRWSLIVASSFFVCSAPLILLISRHIDARPLQYPGFAGLLGETAVLLLGSLSSVLPSTWFWPVWGLLIVMAGGVLAAGSIWALRRRVFDVPVAYGVFLGAFLVMAAVTNKSIAKMPSEYYLGIAAPLASLLVGFGLDAYVLASPAFGALLIAATVGATPITFDVNYREMVAKIRPQCDDCAIVVGMGYGPIPACILYEARNMDMDIFLLTANDTVQSIRQRLGNRRTIFFVPTNEPGTAVIEREFVQAYVSSPRDRYFRLDGEKPNAQPEIGIR